MQDSISTPYILEINEDGLPELLAEKKRIQKRIQFLRANNVGRGKVPYYFGAIFLLLTIYGILIYYFPEYFNADGPTSGLYYFFIFSSLLAYTVYRIIKRRNNDLIDRLSNRIVEIEGEIYKRRDRLLDVKEEKSNQEPAFNNVPTQTVIEPTSSSNPDQYQPLTEPTTETNYSLEPESETEPLPESNSSSDPNQFHPVKEASTESKISSDPDQIQLNFNQ
jgi:hypothetical protein